MDDDKETEAKDLLKEWYDWWEGIQEQIPHPPNHLWIRTAVFIDTKR